MKIKQLLHPFANAMGVFFPTGDVMDGGTCDFATETCKKECCAKREGAATVIDRKQKELILKFFVENSVDEIVIKIISELQTKKNSFILSWFASGDCPKLLTDKI